MLKGPRNAFQPGPRHLPQGSSGFLIPSAFSVVKKPDFCQCLKRQGWTFDPVIKYWVCPTCCKPSIANASVICDGCGETFMPATGDYDRANLPTCGHCEENIALNKITIEEIIYSKPTEFDF